MKFLLLLLSTSAFAQEATQPISPDQMMSTLQTTLGMAAKMPAMFGAIFTMVTMLCMSILIIAKYFYDRNKREIAAFEESKRLELEHNQNAQKIAVDYMKSQSALLNQAYQDDYKRYVDRITQKAYSSVLTKISPVYHDEISKFIYDESQSADVRASKIIYLITKPKA